MIYDELKKEEIRDFIKILAIFLILLLLESEYGSTHGPTQGRVGRSDSLSRELATRVDPWA